MGRCDTAEMWSCTLPVQMFGRMRVMFFVTITLLQTLVKNAGTSNCKTFAVECR